MKYRVCGLNPHQPARPPLCMTDTCVRDSSPAHTQPKGQPQ
nr:MAG TPA: hypothetical protein [Caudoviricetes sp.]